jgi:hypothetical protein
LKAWSGLGERAKHYVRINKTLLGMAEHSRESTYNFESKLMPKTDCRLIGGNHQVELHRTKSSSARLTQRMLTHSAADAEATSLRRDHECRVGHVRTKARLVCSQDVGTDDISFAFCDVTPIRRMQPIRESLFARNIWIKRVGITRDDDGVKDVPNCVTVRGSCLAYL